MKQGWCLVNHLSCLMARILRVKYFDHESFMELKLSGSLNLICKSIWEAIRVISLGSTVKIGNGASISC